MISIFCNGRDVHILGRSDSSKCGVKRIPQAIVIPLTEDRAAKIKGTECPKCFPTKRAGAA